MWQVMISSAMGQPQYFHGINWDEWKPKYVEPVISKKKSKSISKAIRARNVQIGIESSAKVLSFVQEAKKCRTSDLMKHTGLSESSIRRIMGKLVADNKVEKKMVSSKYGVNNLWVSI